MKNHFLCLRHVIVLGKRVLFQIALEHHGRRTRKLWTDHIYQTFVTKNPFETRPPRVRCCHGSWQDKFDSMQKHGVEYFEGVPTHDYLKEWFDDQQGGILVLDDLISEGRDDQDILNLFTQYSHLLNVTVFTCVKTFPKAKYAKTISRNAQYIVVLKNPRDNVALRTLLTQMYPNKRWCSVIETYKHIISIIRDS